MNPEQQHAALKRLAVAKLALQLVEREDALSERQDARVQLAIGAVDDVTTLLRDSATPAS
jgi:hypothetical protein